MSNSFAIPSISSAQLQSALRTEQPPLLLDVRTPVEHRSSHLPGSLLMPLDQLEPDAVRNARDGRQCVVICRSGRRAADAATQLARAGLDDLQLLDGGMQAWEAAGLPVERGQAAISLERQVRIGAGTLVVVGLLLGAFIHPAFLFLSGFVGCGLIFAGVTDWCGMGLLLAKAPWNR